MARIALKCEQIFSGSPCNRTFLCKVSVTSSDGVFVISACLREMHDCHTNTDNFMAHSLLPARCAHISFLKMWSYTSFSWLFNHCLKECFFFLLCLNAGHSIGGKSNSRLGNNNWCNLSQWKASGRWHHGAGRNRWTNCDADSFTVDASTYERAQSKGEEFGKCLILNVAKTQNLRQQSYNTNLRKTCTHWSLEGCIYFPYILFSDTEKWWIHILHCFCF